VPFTFAWIAASMLGLGGPRQFRASKNRLCSARRSVSLERPTLRRHRAHTRRPIPHKLLKTSFLSSAGWRCRIPAYSNVSASLSKLLSPLLKGRNGGVRLSRNQRLMLPRAAVSLAGLSSSECLLPADAVGGSGVTNGHVLSRPFPCYSRPSRRL